MRGVCGGGLYNSLEIVGSSLLEGWAIFVVVLKSESKEGEERRKKKKKKQRVLFFRKKRGRK